MEITANALQTVAANQNVLFTEVPIRGNCNIMHREGSGLVSVKGVNGCCCNRTKYRASFGGNIALVAGGTVGPISLAIAVDGEAIATNTMTVTPAAAGEFNNVSTSVIIEVPRGCCSQISVKNITASLQSVDVQNANLTVERVTNC